MGEVVELRVVVVVGIIYFCAETGIVLFNVFSYF